jgi:hypothetical protein
MRITRQALAATAAVAVAAAGGSAYTAANTGTPLAAAGQESTVTAGFAVSAVKYILDPLATGDELATVTLTLSPTNTAANVAAQVRVQLVSTGSYYECSLVAGATAPATNWTCTITGDLKVLAIDTLDIVAVSQPAA